MSVVSELGIEFASARADGLVYLNRVWHRLGVASRIDDPAI